MELSALKNKIIARYGSIYKFWKSQQGSIAKATIYAVLSGRYGGDLTSQVARIEAALNPKKEFSIFEILKETGCAACDRKPSAKRKRCQKCFNLWQMQAQIVSEATSYGQK